MQMDQSKIHNCFTILLKLPPILPTHNHMSQLKDATFRIKACLKALQAEAPGWKENFLKVKIQAMPEKGSQWKMLREIEDLLL